MRNAALGQRPASKVRESKFEPGNCDKKRDPIEGKDELCVEWNHSDHNATEQDLQLISTHLFEALQRVPQTCCVEDWERDREGFRKISTPRFASLRFSQVRSLAEEFWLLVQLQFNILSICEAWLCISLI
jgi:hypothetical protein